MGQVVNTSMRGWEKRAPHHAQNMPDSTIATIWDTANHAPKTRRPSSGSEWNTLRWKREHFSLNAASARSRSRIP